MKKRTMKKLLSLFLLLIILIVIYFYGDKESLGRAIGKEFRASLAIVDENLAKAVETKLLQNKTE